MYTAPSDRIAHTTAFIIPVVEHWLEREAPWLNNRVIGLEVLEGNVLFNDALNTFYLRLYGVGYYNLQPRAVVVVLLFC